MERKQRKSPRLKNYDYSQSGAYFVTICTKNREHLFAHPTVGADGRGGQGRPPLPKIMQGYKSVTTRMCFQFGYQKIWQRSYYDHIIRNQSDYNRIREYIQNNPLRWEADCHNPANEQSYYYETDDLED